MNKDFLGGGEKKSIKQTPPQQTESKNVLKYQPGVNDPLRSGLSTGQSVNDDKKLRDA